MFWYFQNTAKEFPQQGQTPAPSTPEAQQALVDALQACKTQHFQNLLEQGNVQARPGVLELMDAALADPRMAVGVCSAATKEAARKTLDATLGADRLQQLNVCILGDDVVEKKPHPRIYNTARERLGKHLAAEQCVVIEDSLVGLRAAKAAGMKCIITYTSSTASADFYGEGADAKVPDLASAGVTLDAIFGPLREHGVNAELLVGMKDAVESASVVE
jgi:HAD superfamily hydrolase (TIGR01509 family)